MLATSPRFRVFRLLAPLVVLVGLSMTSCGGKKEFLDVFPVTGRINVNGEPAAECMITLTRTFEMDHPRRVWPYGLTDENGVFKITSYNAGDGAPEGEYIVTIEWKERSGLLNNNFDGMDRLDGAYANVEKNKSQPGFVIKVGRQPLQLPPFELTQSAEAKRKHEESKKRRQAAMGAGS